MTALLTDAPRPEDADRLTTPEPMAAVRPPTSGRCRYTWSLDQGSFLSVVRLMVCDKPDGHMGHHLGRLFRLTTENTGATLIGWVRRP